MGTRIIPLITLYVLLIALVLSSRKYFIFKQSLIFYISLIDKVKGRFIKNKNKAKSNLHTHTHTKTISLNHYLSPMTKKVVVSVCAENIHPSL